MSIQGKLPVVVVAFVAMIVPLAASAAPPAGGPGDPELLAALAGGAGSGSTVGPAGALYVPQPAAGEIWRIDPESGEKTLYASGLPQRFSQLPFGGLMDVAFIGSTAYALVSVVGSVFPDDAVRLSTENRRDLPRRPANELGPRRGHRHIRMRQPAVRVPLRRPDGSAVRARDVSR